VSQPTRRSLLKLLGASPLAFLIPEMLKTGPKKGPVKLHKYPPPQVLKIIGYEAVGFGNFSQTMNAEKSLVQTVVMSHELHPGDRICGCKSGRVIHILGISGTVTPNPVRLRYFIQMYRDGAMRSVHVSDLQPTDQEWILLGNESEEEGREIRSTHFFTRDSYRLEDA